MPRASWKGFLRLSLVSCPVFLTPATTKTKTIRLNRVWVPSEEAEEQTEPEPTRSRAQESQQPLASYGADLDEPEPTYTGPATRVALRPHDPHTGEEIERREVVSGYEYDRGQFVTFTPAELKALDVESSRIIDLATFVPRVGIDPVYFSTPYYVYPDGRVATDAFRVIGQALSDAGMVGIGTITLSRRERMVMVEPRGAGLVLITLRAAEEVRVADFEDVAGEVDAEAVGIAEMIIKRRAGEFDPSTFRDRYQDALRALVEAKLNGRTVQAPAAAKPPPVLDLMAAMKRSLAEMDTETSTPKRRRAAPDRRQKSLLLPVAGKGATAAPASPVRQPSHQRKKA
jgi:DNA end-binding protein Ku